MFVESVERNLKSLKDECQPFRDIRNRRIAHSDLGTALDYHPNPLPGVSRQMIETALGSFRILLNEIEKHFDDNETEYLDFGLARRWRLDYSLPEGSQGLTAFGAWPNLEPIRPQPLIRTMSGARPRLPMFRSNSPWRHHGAARKAHERNVSTA